MRSSSDLAGAQDIQEETEPLRAGGREGKILHVLGAEKLTGQKLAQAERLAFVIHLFLNEQQQVKALGRSSYDDAIELVANPARNTVIIKVSVADGRAAEVEIPFQSIAHLTPLSGNMILELLQPENPSARAGIADALNAAK